MGRLLGLSDRGLGQIFKSGVPRLPDAVGIEECSQPIHWLEAQRTPATPACRQVRGITTYCVPDGTQGGWDIAPCPSR